MSLSCLCKMSRRVLIPIPFRSVRVPLLLEGISECQKRRHEAHQGAAEHKREARDAEKEPREESSDDIKDSFPYNTPGRVVQ